jgi:hypothetical protein
MGAHRELAIAALKLQSDANDFMAEAGIPLPCPSVPGALDAHCRQMVPAKEINMPIDLVIVYRIGDYLATDECSSYYDPNSAWYNVFYGGYGIRSYKRDGSAWGYKLDGTPNFDEFFRVPELDYNFFTAAQFGCPAAKMGFHIERCEPGTKNGWDKADAVVTIPSGLHNAATALAKPVSYITYGVPEPDFVRGHEDFEPVRMRGQMFMRHLPQGPNPQLPRNHQITVAWGALCPDTNDGAKLLTTIIDALGKEYFAIGNGGAVPGA